MECPCLKCPYNDCQLEIVCIDYKHWLMIMNDLDNEEVKMFFNTSELTETRKWQKKFQAHYRRDLKWSYNPVF